MFRRRRRQVAPSVDIDGSGVRRVREDGAVEQVTWAELSEVRLLTTISDGPWADDVFYVLLAGDRQQGCVVPLTFADEYFLNRLQALPGFDNTALIAGMTATSQGQFLLWSAGPGQQGGPVRQARGNGEG